MHTTQAHPTPPPPRHTKEERCTHPPVHSRLLPQAKPAVRRGWGSLLPAPRQAGRLPHPPGEERGLQRSRAVCCWSSSPRCGVHAQQQHKRVWAGAGAAQPPAPPPKASARGGKRVMGSRPCLLPPGGGAVCTGAARLSDVSDVLRGRSPPGRVHPQLASLMRGVCCVGGRAEARVRGAVRGEWWWWAVNLCCCGVAPGLELEGGPLGLCCAPCPGPGRSSLHPVTPSPHRILRPYLACRRRTNAAQLRADCSLRQFPPLRYTHSAPRAPTARPFFLPCRCVHLCAWAPGTRWHLA